MLSQNDNRFMTQALALAQQAIGLSSPNPRVGCVLTLDGKVVGQGFTQAVGQAHAEVMAIADARAQQADLAGCTVYVTLEPCVHFGRTPPCVDALIAIAPLRVVVACLDANPKVAGQGVAALRAAGLMVDVLPDQAVLAQQAFDLNIGFMQRMAHQRVYTRLKWAASIDGKSALNDGRSQWITGSAARQDGQLFRARADVIVTGIGTVLHDNPQLNVRVKQLTRPLIKCVIDTFARVPTGAALWQDGAPVWLVCGQLDAAHAAFAAQQSRLVALSAQHPQLVVLTVPLKHERVDLAALWTYFAAQELNEVHVEAGGTLNASLLAQGLVDELLMYVAPRLMGAGLSAAGFLPEAVLDDLSAPAQWRWQSLALVGEDARLRAQKIRGALA